MPFACPGQTPFFDPAARLFARLLLFPLPSILPFCFPSSHRIRISSILLDYRDALLARVPIDGRAIIGWVGDAPIRRFYSQTALSAVPHFLWRGLAN